MTLKEIKEKWFDMFILIMETAGEETDNEDYKNVKKICEETKLRKQSKNFNDLEDNQLLNVHIIVNVLSLVLRIHKGENLSDEEYQDLCQDMWDRYLRKPTRKFTSRNGILPVPKNLFEHWGITVKNIKDGSGDIDFTAPTL